MILTYTELSGKYLNVKEVLKAYFQISDRLLTKLKKENRIFVNNVSTYVNQLIKINDIVTIDLNFDETSDNIVPTQMNLEIIFEDEAFIIINKSSGIPVHPSQNHYENSLSNGIKYYFEKNNIKRKIRPVNRLDKDTSGIVIFAKNEYIQECLIKQMRNNTFCKEYLAILEGNLEKKSGTINAPISRKVGSIMEREISENGDTSISHYKLIKNFNNFCLVNYLLETGRTHQLRVHSKYIGYPILGDTLYGEASELISRQALHAYKVSFIHPISKTTLTFEAPIPEDMKNLISGNGDDPRFRT